MSSYLTELSLFWLAFWGLYALLLRQEKFFRLNRFYLLGSFALALVLPMLSWSVFLPTPEWLGSPAVWLQTVTVFSAPPEVVPDGLASSWSWSIIFWRIYFMGCLLALARFCYGLYKLWQYYHHGQKRWEGGICWVESDQAHAPFSWLFFLFWSTNTTADTTERAAIIAHEQAHIRQKHSIDILLLEIAGIFFWWHPLWYAYKYELQNVHEYLADEAVLKATPTRDYGKLLLRQCLQQPDLPFVQTFHTSQLKKRIIMMTKSPSSTLALGKYLLFLPLTVFLLFACEDAEAQQDIEQTAKEAMGEVEYFERVDTITLFDPDTYEKQVSIVKNRIYEKVAQMPVLGPCDSSLEGKELEACSNQNLFNFIYENVKYPKEALEASQEGLALTKFVVNANGKVTNVQLIKEKTTEHAALNEAALQTVRTLPDFQPGMHEGKAVSVQIVLPIKFKL